MGPDKMTPYSESSPYNSPYTGIDQRPLQRSGSAPFGPDVLQALENGNVDEAMRLVNSQNQNNPSQFSQLMTELIQRMFAAMKTPFQMFSRKDGDPSEAIKAQWQIKAKLDEMIKAMARLINNVGDMAAQTGRQFSKLFQLTMMPFTVMKNFAVKALSATWGLYDFLKNLDGDKIKGMAQTLMKGVQNLSLKVVDLIKPLTQTMADFFSKQYANSVEQFSNLLNYLDEKTQPFRDKFNEATKKVVEGIETVTHWVKSKVEEITQPVIRFVEHLQKEIADRAEKWKKRGVEAVAAVKDKVSEVMAPIIQPIQQIPEVMAAYAFWLVKHTVTPVGNIKQNIIFIGKQIKKGVSWIAAKGVSTGQFLKKAAIAIGTGCVNGAKAVVTWVTDTFVPMILRFLRWIGEQLYRLAVWAIGWLKAAAKYTSELTVKFVKAGKQFLKQLKSEMNRKIEQFSSYLLQKLMKN